MFQSFIVSWETKNLKSMQTNFLKKKETSFYKLIDKKIVMKKVITLGIGALFGLHKNIHFLLLKRNLLHLGRS